MNNIIKVGMAFCIIALITVPFMASQSTNISGSPIYGLGLTVVSLPIFIIGAVMVIIGIIIKKRKKQ